MDLNIYAGIDDLVRLSDTETQIATRTKRERKKIDLGDNTEFKALRLAYLLHFKDAGVKAYFRNGRVALLEVQEPFHGTIQNKRIKIFPFNIPTGGSWEEALKREFGAPQASVSGGRLGSQALFYSWGDISFNGMGPNQIALYRDAEISTYRQNNFGRVVEFFPK